MGRPPRYIAFRFTAAGARPGPVRTKGHNPVSSSPMPPKGIRTGARQRSRWACRIAARYGLALPEARAELRRCANSGWQLWEFHHRFGARAGGGR